MGRLTLKKLKEIPNVDLGEIFIRAIKYEDYKDMFEYGKDDEVTKTLLWDSYQTINDAQKAVKEVFLSRPEKGLPSAYAIVHKDTMKMIGTCDIFFLDWEKGVGEIGYVLNRKYWNRGYVTTACKAVISFGFNYLGLERMVIRHMEGNIGSKRVIEKLGFIHKEDVYWDKLDKYFPTYNMTKNDFYKLYK